MSALEPALLQGSCHSSGPSRLLAAPGKRASRCTFLSCILLTKACKILLLFHSVLQGGSCTCMQVFDPPPGTICCRLGSNFRPSLPSYLLPLTMCAHSRRAEDSGACADGPTRSRVGVAAWR